MGDEATEGNQGVVLLNPASGGGRGAGYHKELGDLVRSYRLGLKVSAQPGDLIGYARSEVEAGSPIVIAAGGDDTVREVLWGMDQAGVFSRAPEDRPYFGIIPLGTFNNFAHHLNIPLDPRAALKTALYGVSHRVDLGRAGDRLFTESVGVGVDVAAWKIFPKESPSMLRRLWDGVIAILKAVTVFRPRRYFLEIDGQRQSFRAYNVTVANSSYFSAGIAIAPHAVIDDGNLDLCVIPALSKLGFLLSIPIIFLGKHTVYMRGVRYWQVKRVRLWSSKAGALLRIDGRLGPPLPADIQVIPQALPMRLVR